VKIYRRSHDGVAPMAGRSDSSATLGRLSTVGRSPAAAVNGPGSLAVATAKDYPELVRRQLRWDSLSDTRSSEKQSATNSPAINATFKGFRLSVVCFRNLTTTTTIRLS